MSDTSPKIDGINTHPNSSETSVAVAQPNTTEPHISPKNNPQRKPANKGLLFGLLTFVVIVLLVLGATFIKFGSQSIVARALDATGQHQTAFGLDLISTQGFGKISKAGAVDISKPETCKNLWDLSNFKSSDYSAISGSANLKIEPNNPSFKSTFDYESYYKGNINLNDMAASIFTDQKLVMDSDLVQKALGTTSAKSYGVVTLSGKGEALTTAQEAGYINLINLALNTKDFNASGGLNGWYKQDFALTTGQKAGVREIADVVKQNINVRPESVLSPESMKELYAFYCSGLDKVEFGAPKSMPFGTGQYIVNKDVRPVLISYKADAQKIYMAKLPDLVDKIGKDTTFKNFVKSRYDDYIKLVKAGMKLSETTSTSNLPTKEEFDKSVDQFFEEELNKEKFAKSFNDESAQATDEMFIISQKPFEMYLAMDTLEPYGAISSQSITPTAKYLQNTGLIPQDSVYQLLKDGFTFTAQSYNMSIGNKSPKIEIPSKAKPFSEFGSDVQQTPAAQKIQQEIQNQAPEQSPNNIYQEPGAGQIYDPSPMPLDPNSGNPAFLPNPSNITEPEKL